MSCVEDKCSTCAVKNIFLLGCGSNGFPVMSIFRIAFIDSQALFIHNGSVSLPHLPYVDYFQDSGLKFQNTK